MNDMLLSSRFGKEWQKIVTLCSTVKCLFYILWELGYLQPESSCKTSLMICIMSCYSAGQVWALCWTLKHVVEHQRCPSLDQSQHRPVQDVQGRGWSWQSFYQTLTHENNFWKVGSAIVACQSILEIEFTEAVWQRPWNNFRHCWCHLVSNYIGSSFMSVDLPVYQVAWKMWV